MKRNVNIMNEYNENNNIENNGGEINSGYDPYKIETQNLEDAPLKKKKKHTGLKVTAFLMAMAIVSGGSIAAYRGISGEFSNGSLSSSSDSDSDINENDSAKKDDKKSVSAENVSVIKPNAADGQELTTEEIVEKVLPSVVGIESKFTITSQGGSYYYGFGFGGNNTPSTTEATATGTGVVITENGYIVTNAHVIYDSEYNSGLSEDITVVLNGEDRYEAEVIGYDRDCDLAVLKIDKTGLTAAEFGDSDSLKLGESVTAIGNPLGFDLMNTVTRGIVSGMNRQITINDKAMNLIQTDAAINSGNSGGPLINKYGQVIGINSSKMSASYSETSIEGIGFAIPSNEVSEIIDDIMEYGYVTGKPQLGISCQDVNETISQMYNLPVGVYITDVTDGSAADEAGLRSGDVITAVDGTEVKTAEELNIEKNKHEAGDSIEITYVRSGKTETTDAVLDEYVND
ncbi:MAG: trypsin-like peptidase domain-containing protein [Ruminococcus sp.]|nr:trypsin-like peptidase domain-containing protein [Ruminococcus sp.]